MPTSPSRIRPIDLAISDIKRIMAIGRTLYFAVDAMSPSYLRRLAEAIVDGGIEIRWAAELRLERLFASDMASLLRASGCIAVSFGYESGSQRILDAINKGVRLQTVPALLAELRRVNIGVQMMGFIGFPGESEQEAIATFQFLHQHHNDWSLAGIGDLC